MAWQQSLTCDWSSWPASPSSQRSNAGSGLLQNWKELYLQSSAWLWSSAKPGPTERSCATVTPEGEVQSVRNHRGAPLCSSHARLPRAAWLHTCARSWVNRAFQISNPDCFHCSITWICFIWLLSRTSMIQAGLRQRRRSY